MLIQRPSAATVRQLSDKQVWGDVVPQLLDCEGGGLHIYSFAIYQHLWRKWIGLRKFSERFASK